MKIHIFLYLILFFLTSCQSVQDGLTGKKRSDTNDEFFVIKKNPLTMPPDYDKLPKPLNEEELVSDESDIKELISNKSDNNVESNTNNTNLENSILEKINE